MRMVVGLGNPGKEYEKTRHNVGFMVLDKLVKMPEISGDFQLEKKFEAEIAEEILRLTPQNDREGQDDRKEEKVLFVKPMTFMNLSGKAVGSIADFYKIEKENIWIVHDDLDLPFGEIRVRKGGRSGGHNGVESVIERFGEELTRIKIGIGRPEEPQFPAEKYVLESFSKEQEKKLDEIIETTVKIIMEGLRNNSLDNDSINVVQ